MRIGIAKAVAMLVCLPLAYGVLSYTYLAMWYRRVWLFETIVHENGRLTLLGSLFYFDHFLGAVPMIALFALLTVAGVALRGNISRDFSVSRARFAALVLLAFSASFFVLAFAASISTAGWQRTADYFFQRIERDNVMSSGGNWNQFQLSNFPIGLGALGIGYATVFALGPDLKRSAGLIRGGLVCIIMAAALSAGITAFTWPGWAAFLNPRWVAHGIREIATFPLTGVPIALGGILLTERYLSGAKTVTVNIKATTVFLTGMAIAILIGELILLRHADIGGMAQKPAFAPQGLSIAYLLSAHVFEHFLDFLFIGGLSGGIYASVRSLTAASFG